MFEKVDFKSVQNIALEKLGKEGALLLVGNKEKHNNMTIGWATSGILWSKPVVISYVKPTRYTYSFCNKFDTFTICYFDNQNEVLKVCGTKSGRDVNKDELCNLHVVELDGEIAYEEASLVITARKIYQDDFKKGNFLDMSIYDKRYSDDLPHRFYVGEVLNVYKKVD